jgi:serine/threonine-protein kinase
MDRRGAMRLIVSAAQNYSAPRVSPDGRHIAVGIGQPPYTSDIWVYDTVSRTLTRLTSGGASGQPEWTPDGRRITWTSVAPGREGVWWQPWDASAPAELLVPGGRGAQFGPRGDFVLTMFDMGNTAQLRMVPIPLDPRRPAQVILPSATANASFRLSPDGHWLAYDSDETGQREVYVQRFPGPGGRLQISSGGGVLPRWAPNGKELFYVIPAFAMMSATIETIPELTVVRRDSLFSTVGTRNSFDVMPDGNHFVTARATDATTVPILVFGWADRVREKVAAASKK